MLSEKLIQALGRHEWIASIECLLTKEGVPWVDIDDALSRGELDVAGRKEPDGSPTLDSLVYEPSRIAEEEAKAEFRERHEHAFWKRKEPLSLLERRVIARARLRQG